MRNIWLMLSGDVLWAINTESVPVMAKATEKIDDLEVRARKNMHPASTGQASHNIQLRSFFI